MAPARAVVQLPSDPGTLHLSHEAVQSLLQQKPSTHRFDRHWLAAVQL